MSYSTISDQGQVSIPLSLLKELNIFEGDKVELSKSGDRIVLSPIKKAHLMDLCGFLPKPKRALSVEEMNVAIEQSQ